MIDHIRPAIVLTVLLSIITGLLYPLAITGAAQAVFPAQANGSRLTLDGRTIGSELIGQHFSQPGYFWSRPSATAPEPYNAGASSGSNIGPTGKALVERVAAAIAEIGQTGVPADAVTTSGSGLDPHITLQHAAAQIGRVAAARNVDTSVIKSVVDAMSEQPVLGIFGEPRVHVLRLNTALDEAAPIGN